MRELGVSDFAVTSSCLSWVARMPHLDVACSGSSYPEWGKAVSDYAMFICQRQCQHEAIRTVADVKRLFSWRHIILKSGNQNQIHTYLLLQITAIQTP
jgi:hypothetical protein